MSDLDPDVVAEFLQESREHLDALEGALVGLERAAGPPPVHELFRGMHTIKGAAGFLGLERMQALTHTAENLLARVRDGLMAFAPFHATLLLEVVDTARGMLEYFEARGHESDETPTQLLRKLVACCAACDPTPAAVAPPSPARPPAPAAAAPSPPGAEAAPTAPTGERGPARAAHADNHVRLDVSALDSLVNLAGELVLARNRVSKYTAGWTDPVQIATWQRLHQIASQLQEQVMKTRMQPIGSAWHKLPRTVRDLAQQCGKKVRIELEGESTELDRTLIEALRDPLTHILRNAIDHGIEAPAVREEACKDIEGVIKLRAYHDSGQVHVEISDDGAGIRAARVRAKAIERGLIDAEQAERLTEAEVVRLVFMPGFSTAETVTNVSGRGVGMDVVRSSIEKIGGQVDLQSSSGFGTTLRITIPLTLAILPALIVGAEGERYAIPQAMLRELVRLGPDTPLEHVHDAPVLRLRGKLLPLVDLSAAVGGPPLTAPRIVVVIATDGVELGLLIDAYHDAEEIVVKPLGRHLRHLAHFGGATVLGDGGVILVVDARAVARGAGLVGAAAGRLLYDTAGAPAPMASPATGGLLLIRQGERGRFGVPLEVVERLAEVEPGCIERAGPDEVLLLEGELVPVVRLGAALGVDTLPGPQLTSLIVCAAGRRRVGVAVDEVIDILDEPPPVTWANARTGVIGTMAIGDRVFELLDLPGLITATAPHVEGAP